MELRNSAKRSDRCLQRDLSDLPLQDGCSNPSVLFFGAHVHPRYFFIHVLYLTDNFRGGCHP